MQNTKTVFTFTNRKTGKEYQYATRARATSERNKIDLAYGAIITSQPKAKEIEIK